MRKFLFAICIASVSVLAATPAAAQISLGYNTPGVSIGINVGAYPRLVPIPGYPVYYAPQVNANYFFYDGMFWSYSGDNWYTSAWYNGPWELVSPIAVPAYVLRIPVRYYRRPPPYFHAWAANAPPHWGEHWGSSWAQSRSGWDRWNRSAVARPAPLPAYQHQYSANRYPTADQQRALHAQNYRYRSREATGQPYHRGVESAGAPQRQAQLAQHAQRPPQPQHAQRPPQQPQQRQAAHAQRPQHEAQQREERAPGKG